MHEEKNHQLYIDSLSSSPSQKVANYSGGKTFLVTTMSILLMMISSFLILILYSGSNGDKFIAWDPIEHFFHGFINTPLLTISDENHRLLLPATTITGRQQKIGSRHPPTGHMHQHSHSSRVTNSTTNRATNAWLQSFLQTIPSSSATSSGLSAGTSSLQSPYHPRLQPFHPSDYISITKRLPNNTNELPPQLQRARIAFVTAIVGNYETTCKIPIKQTIPTDFIIYTDNPTIQQQTSNSIWKSIDITRYQYGLNDRDKYKSKKNSLINNQHPFNKAKFIKLNLHRLPELHGYDVIVWIDGTIKITNPMCSELIFDWLMNKGKNIMVYEHKHGTLAQEVNASHYERYTSTYWLNHTQPYQDIDAQYKYYIEKEHYEDRWFMKELTPNDIKESTGNIPVNPMYLTNFIAFNMKNEITYKFLDLWYDQIMTYTTQDQISFVYTLFKLKLLPFNTIASGFVFNDFKTQLFEKLDHGL